MSDAHELDLSDHYFEQFLTKTEVAAERRVSVDTIDRMVRRGELPNFGNRPIGFPRVSGAELVLLAAHCPAGDSLPLHR